MHYNLHPERLPPLQFSPSSNLHSLEYTPIHFSFDTSHDTDSSQPQRRRRWRSIRSLDSSPNIDSPSNHAFVPLLPTPSLSKQQQQNHHHRLQKLSSPSLVHLLAGGLAPASVKALLQPLDTLKTRLQARSTISVATSLATSPRSIASWWRGVIPGVLGTCPAAAVFMLIYETIKRYEVRGSNGKGRGGSRRLRVPVAASVANFVACLIRVPCEVVKQRLQVGQYGTVGQAFRGVAAGGRSVIYGGFGALVARDVPFAVVNFGIYETLKGVLLRRREVLEMGVEEGKRKDRELSKTESLGLGGIAGMAGAFVSNPMDVVKTRMMTQTVVRNVSSSVAGTRYRSVIDCFLRVAKEEGVHSFARGIGPRLAQKGMQYALYFAAYETLKTSIAAVLKVDMARDSSGTKLSSRHAKEEHNT